MKILRSDERGVSELGWLHSKHSFSFGEYYSPQHMGYRTLRVINDDLIEPGQGFGTHGHKDMEIISLVYAGALEHRDSLGHGEVLRPGEVQVMSAGSGIRHSEFNPSQSERVHLIQIWITPEKRGLTPEYAQQPFSVADRTNRLLRVAGAKREVADQALRINQDADVFLSRVEPNNGVRHTIQSGRGAWIHLTSGEGLVDGVALGAGDAAAIEGPHEVVLSAGDEVAEFIVFDLK